MRDSLVLRIPRITIRLFCKGKVLSETSMTISLKAKRVHRCILLCIVSTSWWRCAANGWNSSHWWNRFISILGCPNFFFVRCFEFAYLQSQKSYKVYNIATIFIIQITPSVLKTLWNVKCEILAPTTSVSGAEIQWHRDFIIQTILVLLCILGS